MAECPDDTLGTYSDHHGFFTLVILRDVPCEITISHIGYETISKRVSGQQNIQFKLTCSSLTAPELSIVGTGSLAAQEVQTGLYKIESKKIEQSGFRNLEQSLIDESSIIINRDFYGRETVSIRGSNSNEVGVFVDGVLVNTPYYGNADLSAIDLFDMEEIEVVKGGGTTLLGSGYFGGVVNLKSRAVNTNSFAVKYGGSSIYSDDRDRYYSLGAQSKYVGISYRFSRKDRPLIHPTQYTSEFENFGINFHLSSGELILRNSSQSYRFSQDDLDSIIADSTGQYSLQYIGTLPLAGDNWTLQYSRRTDSNSDHFWEISSMGQESSDQNQSVRMIKSLNWNDITAAMVISVNSQEFGGSSRYNIDTLYLRNSQTDIDRQSAAAAFTAKFHSYNISKQVDRITLESGFRFEWFQSDMSKLDHHVITGSNANTRIDSTRWKASRHIRTRKVGISADGQYRNIQYIIYTTMSKDIRLPILRDIFNIEMTPIYAYRGNVLYPEILNDLDLGFSSTIQFDGKIATSLTLNGDIFKNQYYNKSYYVYPQFSPPVPVQTDHAEISGYHIGVSHKIEDDLFAVTFNHTSLNLSDSRVFPFKPETNNTASAKLNWKNLTLYYQYFSEGKQFIPGGFAGEAKRENASVSASFTLHKNNFKLVLNYRIENLFSEKTAGQESLSYYLPADYFKRYNETAMIQILFGS